MTNRFLLLRLAVLGFSTPLLAGQLICHFDAATDPEVNDFGSRTSSGPWTLSAEGTGCPANPQGRALAAGVVGGPAGVLEVPIAPGTSLAQGTMECWVKTQWDWQTNRDQHSFLYIKMEGGYWNSICLYHHGRMGEARTLAFNINDGIDHCLTCPVEQLGWKANEWHHLAASWTEHSQWLFADGKLVAKGFSENPMSFAAPSGPLKIAPPGLWGSATGAWMDEVRFSDRPWYVGQEAIAVPRSLLPHTLPRGLLESPGVRIAASSTAPPFGKEEDVLELHNGRYGDGVWIDRDGKAWVRADLPKRERVTAVRWSRDGRPLKGPDDWADAKNIPRDFAVEVSLDGQSWQTVVAQTDFYYDPDNLPREGMIFEHRFAPVEARNLRMVVSKGQPEPVGPRVALDEFQVIDARGRNVTQEARIVTARTSYYREYDAKKLVDGRVGEASCWRAAAPGEAWIEVTLPQPREIHSLLWSRSTERFKGDGTPKDVVVEAEIDGKWAEVARIEGNDDPGVHLRPLRPATISRMRLRILSTVDGKEAVLDEIALD